MNKYQKYLNLRARRLFKSTEGQQDYNSYRDCRKHWHYALQNHKHYVIMLKDLNIVKR